MRYSTSRCIVIPIFIVEHGATDRSADRAFCIRELPKK